MEETIYYLSGPMTGLPKFNYDTFANVALILRNGYHLKVRSPHEIDNEQGTEIGKQDWQWYMKHSLVMELECSSIIMLPGWTRSQGARAELEIAINLGYDLLRYAPEVEHAPPIMPLDDWEIFYD